MILQLGGIAEEILAHLARSDFILASWPNGAGIAHRWHMVVHLVDRQRLLDVSGKVASGALEGSRAAMILHVPVQIPFVGRAEVAGDALDHRHGVVLDVLAKARLDVGHIAALVAAEELGLAVLGQLVGTQLGSIEGGELAGATLEQPVLGLLPVGGGVADPLVGEGVGGSAGD